MKKWEYKTIRLIWAFKTEDKDMLEEKCNELGKEGWELVNFQYYDMSSRCMLIFKRESN